jgi:hypothetical protein
MAGNVENKITIETAAVIWLACTAIALGSYWAHTDIGFWPGFITWFVFIVGIIFFVLSQLAKL